MFSRYLFLAVVGLCSGLFVSGGVFTVLLSVGLIPRFAGKTNTANRIFFYEEMVIWGLLFGTICSVFLEQLPIGQMLVERNFISEAGLVKWGTIFLVVFGLFAGVFVGSLAIAIAEMLDSIPIFARRIGFRKGLGFGMTTIAIGKICGSIIYFFEQIYHYGG